MADIESRVEKLEDWRSGVDKQMAEIKPIVYDMKDEIFNHDGVKGVKTIVIEEFAKLNAERSRRWSTSNRLAAVGIIMTLLAWPSAKVWSFVVDVYQITQEWHQTHKSEIDKIPKMSGAMALKEKSAPISEVTDYIPQ
jgi:hypothetical protein